MSVEPFAIRIPQSTLDDLRDRLNSTRSSRDDATDWDAGTSPAYLRDLLGYWRTQYDWRAQEAELNQLAHYLATMSGVTIHFVHARGRGLSPFPLILTHGYPDSFLRFRKLIPLLTDPASHGADPLDAFDVVVPSLPGYGFSDKPDKAGGTFDIGALWRRLMTSELGYERFGAHGGDWGSTITEHLARSHSTSVAGIHLTDVPFWHSFQKPDDPSPDEQKYLDSIAAFQMKNGAYAMIQGTRPLTLADSLNDSPVGLAAWLVGKFQRWSDCNGDVEQRFTKDELLTNIMLYWVTETIGTSFLPYYDVMHAGAPRWIVEKAKDLLGGAAKVPAGFAMFPKDLSHPPREWAERFYDVQRWTELPRGGHFAALEEPHLLADEIRAFFRPLRTKA